jgi:methyl-accepting chemotaxis protein
MNWFTKTLQTIRGRLTLGSLFLTLGPLLLAGTALTLAATELGRRSLQARANEQLVALRTVKGDEIAGYFGSLGKIVSTMAGAPEVVQGLQRLSGSFAAVAPALGTTADERRAAVARYFGEDFVQEYGRRNAGASVDMAGIVSGLSDDTIALQYLYIASNAAPLGSKNDLDAASADPTSYSQSHAALHPFMRRAIGQFGFYDFFLVTNNGDVVYTFFKEADFSTNLMTGPYAKTKLGEAFRAAREATDPNALYLSDFAPYLPSYQDQAAFISIPMLSGNEKIGALIAQIPIDQINRIMTLGGRWRESGLGESGETYLVGPDNLARSVSRFAQEDLSSFATVLTGVGVAKNVVDQVVAKKTNIGLVAFDTRGTREALGGQAGVGTYPDYRQIPVLGAYAPIDILGLRWAILAEIDESEAFAPVKQLRNTILLIGAGTLLILGLVGWLISRRLSNSINRPLGEFQGVVQKIAGGDGSARVRSAAPDEIGDLARAFDNLLDERVATLERAAKENEQLNNSVIEIMGSVAQLAQRDLTVKVPVTADVTGAISDAINLMTSETSKALRQVNGISGSVAEASTRVRKRSEDVMQVAERSNSEANAASQELATTARALREMADQSKRAAQNAESAIAATGEALNIVRSTVEGISLSRDQIRETEKRVKRLGERSQEISSVVGIIGQIAERTSVLALNASMQAVAAGDAGRGFAVVADEVKRLAENARQATQQIGSLVTAIQADTVETIQAMNNTIAQVVDISRLAERAGGQMTQTRAATEDLVSSVREIAASTDTQARASSVLIERARQLIDANQKTLTQLGEQRQETEQLVNFAKGLVDTVQVFRLPSA